MLRQRALLIRHTGRAHSIGTTDHLHFTADHFRVVDEILVQRDAVFCFSNVYPRCVLLQDSAALLQKQNVGGHFRTGIALERGVGQTYCADQVTPRGKVLAHFFGLFIQCAGSGDERHNAADTQFIYRLG